MKKIFFCAVVLMAAAIAVSFLLFSRRETDDMVVRLSYNSEGIDNAPLMIAKKEGFFEKNGVNIELIQTASSKEAREAIAAGTLDMASIGLVNNLITVSKGAPVKLIGGVATSSISLFVRPDGSVASLKDLAGKAVAANKGSSNNLALRYALILEGLDPSSVNFVDVDSTYRPMALMEQKAVEAVIDDTSKMSKYLSFGAIVLPEWQEKNYDDSKIIPIPTVLMVNTDFLSQHSALVEGVVDAMIDGERFIAENQDEAKTIIVDYINTITKGAVSYSMDDIQTAWDSGVKYQLWFREEEVEELVEIAKAAEVIETNLTIDQIFDLRFKEKLLAAEGEIYGED